MINQKCETTIDFSNLDRMMRMWQELDNTEIAYGYPDENEVHQASGQKLGNVAHWNNYGTKRADGSWHIPPRDFMTIAGLIVEDEHAWMTKQITWAIQKGTLNKGLDFIGHRAADAVREAIGLYDYIPNAQSTINLKGSDTPLIETTELHDKAKFVINK